MKRVHVLALLVAASAVFALTAAVISQRGDKQPAVAPLEQQFEVEQVGSEARAQAVGIGEAPDEKTEAQHAHAALRVVYQGALYFPRQGVGISERGRQLAVHTHDNTGVLHFHAAQQNQTWTLKQVLAVWGVPAQGQTLAGLPAKLWINGKSQRFTVDARLPDRADVIVALDGDTHGLPAFDWSAVPLAEQRD